MASAEVPGECQYHGRGETADNVLGLLMFALWPPITLPTFDITFGLARSLIFLIEVLLWVDRSGLGVDEMGGTDGDGIRLMSLPSPVNHFFDAVMRLVKEKGVPEQITCKSYHHGQGHISQIAGLSFVLPLCHNAGIGICKTKKFYTEQTIASISTEYSSAQVAMTLPTT